MPLEEIVSPTPEAPDAEVAARPAAIEVRNLVKTFEIPLKRVDSIKERVLHPLQGVQTRRLVALSDISFDVHRGEFFGIVGRNGTGKSTLLKILASIYRAEAGSIRMAGRVAPFIELGVGFNPDLTARENVILNGVLMGLRRDDAESRLEAVIEFAELEEFADLKLKNYSSGMLVRLAFAVMIQSDSDILLIDEVLAVGDAAFQQKCKDVFHEIRGSDRTVVLVTHDMSAVEQYCHRAMLLDGGDIVAIGDPDEVAHRYLRLNFAAPTADGEDGHPVAPDGAELLLLDAWVESAGERTTNVEQGAGIEFHAIFQAPADIPGPSFGFVINNAEGVEIGGFGLGLESAEGAPDVFPAGEQVHVRAKIANRLTAGRYAVQCWVHRNHSFAEPLIASPRILDFVVYGTDATVGLVDIIDEAGLTLGPKQ
ncbi:MAG: ABC transporter ATP-binding protein [Solirubrobacterales bacterium]|jgi:ABC-type polysaccharide/polyol phosphate transport system ATPase subunit